MCADNLLNHGTADPPESPFGTWGAAAGCPFDKRVPKRQWVTFIDGARIKMEKMLGDDGDDTAANRIQAHCQGSYERIEALAKTDWGRWLELVLCPEGTAVCGVGVRIEPNQGRNRDDTGLNGIRLACCALPKQWLLTRGALERE